MLRTFMYSARAVSAGILYIGIYIIKEDARG